MTTFELVGEVRTMKIEYVMCIEDEGFPVSLEICKVYRRVEDEVAERRGFLRIVDETGEDYLYPKSHFVSVDLPASADKIFAKAG